MNRITALLEQYNRKLAYYHFEFAQNFGLSRQRAVSFDGRATALMHQLLTVAEVNNYRELADCVAMMAEFPEDSWPEQFDTLAKHQWQQTCGTALGYLERPRSIGYRLLADLAKALYPTLTPKQIQEKLVRGNGWGVRAWVQVEPVYEERLAAQRKIDNFHAVIQEVPNGDACNWQAVVTDGSVALDVAALLNSFQPHWHRPIARRLLQEFLAQLKQQYPDLYRALRNYNATTQLLLSYLDLQQTPREAIEQLRYVLTAETKLLTGQFYVSQASSRAVALFSDYMDSLSPAEKDQMLALTSDAGSLGRIRQDMEHGECVDLISENLAKILREPANTAFLDRAPRRENVSLATHQAWMHTAPQALVAREQLSHHIPLNWLRTVIANLRLEGRPEGGRILSALFNVLRADEFKRFLGEMLAELGSRKILALSQGLEYPKLTTLLKYIDASQADNPFDKLTQFAQLLDGFSGSKSGLFQLMPETVARMTFELPEFMRVTRLISPQTAQVLMRAFQGQVTLMIHAALQHREHVQSRAVLLTQHNYPFVVLWLKSLPAAGLPSILELYGPLAFASGQLGLVLSRLNDDQMTSLMPDLCRSQEMQHVIATQFERFVSETMQAMTSVQQPICMGLLVKHCRPSLLRMMDATKNLSTLCYQLDSQGLIHVTGMLHSLVRDDIMAVHRFRTYAAKFDEFDLEELLQPCMPELTENMLRRRGWLTVVLESLPDRLALQMWALVKEHDHIHKALTLRDIARLSVVLPAEEFDAMFDDLQPNIVSGLAEESSDNMAIFSHGAVPRATAMKAWLWLRFDAIATTITGFHNFLVTVDFLSHYANSQTTLPCKQQVVMAYKGKSLTLHYSTYFDALAMAGHLNLANRLRIRLKELVKTPEDYLKVSKRLFSNDTDELLRVIRPQLLQGPLQPDDFVKFSKGISFDRQEWVWLCLQHRGSFGITLKDMRQLAQTLSYEGLQAACHATQAYVVNIISNANDMQSLLAGLPEASQALLLEWARSVVAAPFQALQSNSVFALTAGAVQPQNAPATTPKP